MDNSENTNLEPADNDNEQAVERIKQKLTARLNSNASENLSPATEHTNKPATSSTSPFFMATDLIDIAELTNDANYIDDIDDIDLGYTESTLDLANNAAAVPTSPFTSLETPTAKTSTHVAKSAENDINQEVQQRFRQSREQIANGISEFRSTQQQTQDYIEQIKAEVSSDAQELKSLDYKIKHLNPKHEISLLIDALSTGSINAEDIVHLLEAEKHIFQQRNCSLAAQRLTDLSRTQFEDSAKIKETIDYLNKEIAIIGLQSEKINVLQRLKIKADLYGKIVETKTLAESAFVEMVSFINTQKNTYIR